MGVDDISKCTGMDLDSSLGVMLVHCAGAAEAQSLGERHAQDWADIQARFGPFVYETATERLVFHGSGVEASEAWQRAILAWARVTHAELATGRASATGRTALSWRFAPLPEQPDVCTHLTVLNDGYATVETVNCEGGEVVDSKGDWLTPDEMVQLDAWLYGYEPLYLDANYLDGQGSQAMDATTSAAVAQWATDVQARLWRQP